MRSGDVRLVVALIAASGFTRSAVADPAAVDSSAVTWHCGDPIPPGFHRVGRERKQLIARAAIVFGAPYAISAVVAADNFPNPAVAIGYGSYGALWIPAVGPFLELDKGSTATKTLLVADGIVQVGGLAMLAYALATPTFAIVRDGSPNVAVAPMVNGASGLVVMGRF